MNHQCLTVLEHTIRCTAPQEGCALLLGHPLKGDVWRLSSVWPCCNIWHPPTSRRSRFALDPREQLAAQRWARARGERVIGVAHGHPDSEAYPSFHDRRLGLVDHLMVIVGVHGDLRAWWLRFDRSTELVPITVQDTLKDEIRSERPS